MDRELETSYRYRRVGRRAAVWIGAAALVALILILLPGWLRPSVAREQVRTGRVDRGSVEGVVEASGTVVPAFEGVISSPVEARVEKVLKRPGDLVKAGDPILALDTSSAQLDLGKLEDQLGPEGQRAAAAPDQPGAEPQRSARPIETKRLDAEVLDGAAGAEPAAAPRTDWFRRPTLGAPRSRREGADRAAQLEAAVAAARKSTAAAARRARSRPARP